MAAYCAPSDGAMPHGRVHHEVMSRTPSMLIFKRTKKNFAFITGYLWLLALPMLLGIGGMFALSVYNHGVVVEQKLVSLNSMAVVAEARMLDHIEQLMAVEVTADKLNPVISSTRARQEYRELWGNKAALDSLITLIFYADSTGRFFSGSEEADQAWVNARVNVNSRAWFKGALAARTFYWTPAYQDILTGDYILTLAHRLTDGQQEGARVIGTDVNVAEWSQMLRDMLYGDNALSHMVIDRRTNQILMSTSNRRRKKADMVMKSAQATTSSPRARLPPSTATESRLGWTVMASQCSRLGRVP